MPRDATLGRGVGKCERPLAPLQRVRRLGWLAGPRHASRQASDASSASGCDVHEEKSERLEVQEPEGSSRVSGGG